jgi:Cupin domain
MPGRREPTERDPEPTTHEGHEWLHVLNGRLRLVLGDQDLVLTPGEVAEFDTRLPHRRLPADEAPVELLILFDRQGERVHVRARSRGWPGLRRGMCQGVRPRAEIRGAVARSGTRPAAMLARCSSISVSVASPAPTSRSRICSTVVRSSTAQAGEVIGK